MKLVPAHSESKVSRHLAQHPKGARTETSKSNVLNWENVNALHVLALLTYRLSEWTLEGMKPNQFHATTPASRFDSAVEEVVHTGAESEKLKITEKMSAKWDWPREIPSQTCCTPC
jgi:hypothetical protein